MTTPSRVILALFCLTLLCSFRSEWDNYSGYKKEYGCKRTNLKGKIRSYTQIEHRGTSNKIIKTVELYDETGNITSKIDTFFARPEDSFIHADVIPVNHFRYETYQYIYNDKKQLVEKKFAMYLNEVKMRTDEVYQYHYNDKGQLEWEVAHGNKREVPDNSSTKYYYNKDGTLKMSRSFPPGPVDKDSITRQYKYNTKENSVMEYVKNFITLDCNNKSSFDKNGNLLESINYSWDCKEETNRTSIKYDQDGWPERISTHDELPDVIITNEQKDSHGNYLRSTGMMSTSIYSVVKREIVYYE